IAAEAAALHEVVVAKGADASIAVVRDGLARIGRSLGTGDTSVGPRAKGERPRREAVTLPTEPELWRAFTLECTELLDALERETLDLEHSDTPKDRIRSVLRHAHTLKGVVNTMGLTPTGAVIHRVEDLLEAILERPVLPSMRDV